MPAKKTAKAKDSLAGSLKKLEEIAQWFEEQEEVDVEEGIAQVRAGATLIKDTKKKLTSIENEFEEIKKSLDT